MTTFYITRQTVNLCIIFIYSVEFSFKCSWDQVDNRFSNARNLNVWNLSFLPVFIFLMCIYGYMDISTYYLHFWSVHLTLADVSFKQCLGKAFLGWICANQNPITLCSLALTEISSACLSQSDPQHTSSFS